MNLFYQPEIDLKSAKIVFDKEESRHITKVLRNKVGDLIYSTNGMGQLVKGRLESITPKVCTAKIEAIETHAPLPYTFHLAVAPTKNNDRFEWFLEKATEIGIDEITPIICDRSERKVIKPERMEKVLQSAMKQSMQAYLPKLNPAVTYNEFIEQEREGLLFIAHCEDDEKMELKRRVAPDKDITILIGPEGDFSRNEIDKAYEKGFLPVSLGQNRLRTETAAIVACTTVNLINNG